MRILLIEDEPEMASVLKTALERQDLVVDHVSTLADAEAMARLGTFDAVVLDRRLPDGDGLSLIPRLRALHVDAPVIALTAMSGLDDRVSFCEVRRGQPQLRRRSRQVLERLANPVLRDWAV